MSRALDKDVWASLKNANHEEVFVEISTVLIDQHDERLLEIELLGRSHPLLPGENLLRDGNAVAIPKLRLVQAFLVAYKIFQKYLDGTIPITDGKLMAATAVLLLLDPEHLTAANTRKSALQKTLANSDDAKSILQREKRFLDGLLTSRLHRHTKSPILWSHRRWVLQQYRAYGASINIQSDMRKVIMVAAERHPRNYYAWCHARWLVASFQGAVDENGGWEKLHLDARDWCFRHHNDVSGWSFLTFLLDDKVAASEIHESDFIETLKLATTFQWKNESVWWFLRTLAANGRLKSETCKQLFKTCDDLMAGASADSEDRRILEQAMRWYKENQQHAYP
jgi:protein prenyltransferase alpha subunit repeat containing protein 1